jgi:hypothetical protein
MDSLHHNDDLEAVPPPEESGLAIEDPRCSFFSGRKKTVAAVFSIVVVAAIAMGVALSVKPSQKTDLEQSSVALADNETPLDGEEFDIIEDQGFSTEYPEGITYDEGYEPRESEIASTDLGEPEDGTFVAPEKVPINSEDVEIAEFSGLLTDFVVTSEISRIDTPTNNKCANPSEGLWLMQLVTDNYPWETAYTVKDGEGNVVMAGPPEGRKYDRLTKYVGSMCMPAGQYLLELTDKGKDGICCEYGNGTMVVNVNGKTVASTGNSDFSSFKRYIAVKKVVTTPNPTKKQTALNPTKKPTPKPIMSPAINPANLHSVDISVKTDNYAKETGYKFEKVDGNVLLLNKAKGSLTTNMVHKNNFLVEKGQYRFTITDDFAGLEGGGYFAVSVDGEEVLWDDKWQTQVSKSQVYTIGAGYQPTMTSRDRSWLTAHNTRRKIFHEAQGKTYRPLVWSTDLADAASNWVDEIISTCKITRESGLEEGENISTRTASGERNEGPDVILARWVDKKSGQGFPNNQSMTQALWRGTRYVGCKDKMTVSSAGVRCYVSICRYARAGNCAMGQYNGDWKTGTLADRTKCGPPCPSNTCY